MPIRKTYIFENCLQGVEDLYHPDTKEIIGKVFVILEPDTGNIYRCPMSENVAKKNGQALMGIGKISVVDELQMKKELTKK